MMVYCLQAFIKAHEKCKAFHKGGDSSCHAHICQHYNLYKQKCKKENILMSHWAIPHDIWETMEEKEGKTQRLTNEEAAATAVRLQNYYRTM
ncbi:uncharacterized protein LACBIDRAFT_315558 [Laccaria bicolor S238N-H82]|uniref:Predicted protein n=1 Tax=Laccaria bicolor (strain S238N-H82 / ATCC MYA-4686) TaxID=486041 RepID=B0D2N1_LACBS|nr:uncharacterized protein LACBIDRAFT_315558 [Laccaria bicolor S238N-H82]EDR10780.1 predicted protein [Laccaria bicolor S238N-H82]|eukprot:XP_001878081.1 predicted protein [Laccaria bicolor S238N-H82]